MINEALQEAGLNRRESACYLALLELGSSKTGAIVKRSKIPSSKIYEVLDRLAQRGLVSHVKVGKIKRYQAADPKVLLELLNEKKRSIEEVLPQLLLRQKFTQKQSVEMYEGQKAIFTLYTNILKDAKIGERYCVFSINEENKNDATNLFFKNLAARRKEKKLEVLLLKNKAYYAQERHTKLKMRFTDFGLPQGITIFRSTVVIISWVDTPVAIRIESETIASQLRAFFMDLWKKAK